MRSRSAAPLLLTVTLLAACAPAANDVVSPPRAADASTGSPSSRTSSTGPARRVDPREHGLEVGFGEFAITLEADEIRPGPVTFVIRNGGALVHGFEIEGEDDDGDNSGPGNGELKLEGPEFGPGNVVRIHADLPAGIYEIECFVADHDDRGMRTSLIVRPGAPLIREGGRRSSRLRTGRRLRVLARRRRGRLRHGGHVDERGSDRPHGHGGRRLVRLRNHGPRRPVRASDSTSRAPIATPA